MNVTMTEHSRASVLLELADHELITFGPDEIDSVDQQLIAFCDALRTVCALQWECQAKAVRCTVQREHSLAEGCQRWRVTADHVASWDEELAVALPTAARARLQAAQKKRAGSAGPQW